ncbi:amidase [Alginatibacterium sediminis]|uniref:Amidase n=1 Tax=Alginatibacterium sediminis TaxID=2164068 RepID=A0A420EGU9_9ALTE|nr:amidase family protein [Alginatibacterium sediminis]RKF19897.1 amidase [Alginatibacterium sediminis]
MIKLQDYSVGDISDQIRTNTQGTLCDYRLSVKDLFDVVGHKTGAGSPLWLAHAKTATRNAKAVDLLVAQGVQLAHKTQLDELAYSLAGYNEHYGYSLHPLDKNRLSGGSSSGAAISVSLDESDIGLATDTGGSIRVPASYCGLYGLRPSFGRISTQGMLPLAPRFDTVGVLCRDLVALDKAYQALFDGSKLIPSQSPINTLVWCESVWYGVEQQLKDHAKSVYEAFDGPKHQIPSPILNADQRRQCFSILQAHSIWQCHGHWLADNLDSFGEDTAQRLQWGQSITDQQLADAEALFNLWVDHQDRWLPDGCSLLMPTVPSIAPRIDLTSKAQVEQRNVLLSLTSIAGLSAWPQLQCPAISIKGLPLGLSLLGRYGCDSDLIRFADRIFTLTDDISDSI